MKHGNAKITFSFSCNPNANVQLIDLIPANTCCRGLEAMYFDKNKMLELCEKYFEITAHRAGLGKNAVTNAAVKRRQAHFCNRSYRQARSTVKADAL